MRDLPTIRPIMFLRRGLLATSVLLVMIGAAPCGAQFTGPALTIPRSANRPLTPTSDPLLLLPPAQDLRVGPGDTVLATVFGATSFAPPVRVSVDGSIQLPLVGLVPVAGLTLHQAEDRIASRLSNAGMYVDPQVTLQITESISQYATVTGELHAVVPILGERRLLEVLAIATPGGGGAAVTSVGATAGAGGGFPPTASHVITIIRQGQTKPIVVDLGTDPSRSGEGNIPVLPQDLIIVSRVGVVYVVGAFNRQGAIPLDQNTPLTLMQATSLSGGIGFEGRYDDLRIIRTIRLERETIQVDVKRILQGKSPDPVLQADDIVFLPPSAVKAAIKSGGIQTLASLADLAIIALGR